MAKRYYGHCRDFLEMQKPDLVHVLTPDAGAMVMIRAGHDAGIPVIYQELGIPFHPPGFEYYREFASVLPLCSEVAALSPRLFADCLQKAARFQCPVSASDHVPGVDRWLSRPRHAGAKVTFGFAARMEELKGPMVLMEAWGRLSAV